MAYLAACTSLQGLQSHREWLDPVPWPARSTGLDRNIALLLNFLQPSLPLSSLLHPPGPVVLTQVRSSPSVFRTGPPPSFQIRCVDATVYTHTATDSVRLSSWTTGTHTQSERGGSSVSVLYPTPAMQCSLPRQGH